MKRKTYYGSCGLNYSGSLISTNTTLRRLLKISTKPLLSFSLTIVEDTFLASHGLEDLKANSGLGSSIIDKITIGI